MFAAFYNGFPLVTSDSGTYIYSGFKQYVPSDRPFVYGFFIRHSSLKSSFWFTILAQGIIMSFLLWQVLNRFTGKRSGMVGKFILFILVAAFSSVSWVTSELMPDMFSAAGILAFLLLLQRDSGKANTLFNALIIVLACLVHNSHLLLFSILSLVLPAYLLLIRSVGSPQMMKGTKALRRLKGSPKNWAWLLPRPNQILRNTLAMPRLWCVPAGV